MPNLLRVCAGLIALHVADDMLIQPQPGTSALDHLPGALVQLAVILGAVWLAERGKPGLRAALAGALALFALVVSGEALQQTSEVGPAGDDFSGLLLVPAGLALAALAAVTAWRSRRRGGRRSWRYGRRALRAVGTLAALSLVAVPVALGYLTTHVSRAQVPRDELGVAHEDVQFETSDGLTLKGWYIPSRNGAAVIAFPGRKGSQRPARILARHGYGVLLFDRRGEGDSDGDPNSWGWGGDRDVHAAVRFLERRADVDDHRIAGLGLSVGGEMMLEAAAETDALDAVIAEGAGARSFHEEVEEMDGLDYVLGPPLVLAKAAAVSVFSSSSPPPSLYELIPRIDEPVMLIHGDALNDRLGPDYNRLLGGPKEYWYLPEAAHMGAITARPAEYERRLIGFLERSLRRSGRG